MAIKIDLLPKYVGLSKKFHRSIAASIVLLALLVGGLSLVYHSRQLELETAQTNLRNAQTVATLVETADTATQTANNNRLPLDTANGFMLSSTKSGPERAALLNLVRQYIYSDSMVSSIDISDGRTVTILATVRSPDEYVNFLLSLRRATGVLFASDAVTSGVGGFANGAAPYVPQDPPPGSEPVVVNYPIAVKATAVLINPIQLPVDPVGGGTAGAGGAGALGSPSLGSPGSSPARP